MSEAFVLFEECANGLAILTIDRQKALNAADVEMVQKMREAIAKVRASDTVKALLLQGAGPKGFCSGGDVKALHPALVADPATSRPKDQVFNEYSAIFELRQVQVPIVSLLHGITMGFGIGFGTAAQFRIATEKSRFAMPENNIGLFPDACFPYVAANGMPPGLGELMAITGVHLIGAGDVMAAKLADYFVEFESLQALVQALRDADLSDASGAITACLATMAKEPQGGTVLEKGAQLLPKFAGGSLPEAIEALEAEAEAGGWAAELLPLVKKGCPFSQAVVWRLLELAREDATAGVPEPARAARALERDYAVAARVLYRPDFLEGVRAVLVDKDNKAAWQPATLAEVSADEVEAALAPLPEDQRLGLPVA